MDLYKIVGPNGEPLNGGHGDWPLPHDGLPGDWRDVDGPLEACRNGLHLAAAGQVAHWTPSHGSRPFVIYRAETRGEVRDAGDKWVAQSVRLLPRSRPMPDMAAAETKRRAAIDAAQNAAKRRERRARKLLDVAVPPVWQRYLSDSPTLPVGHPGRVYQAALRDARAAYDAATDWPRCNAAITRADAAYARTLTGGAMPD